MAERDEQGGHVDSGAPVEGWIHAGEYVFTKRQIRITDWDTGAGHVEADHDD